MKRTETTVKAGPTLPDTPLHLEDLPETCPAISQRELVAYGTARHLYLIACADYERKHAELTYKLIQFCKPEPGDISAHLDEEGRLVVVDSTLQGPAPMVMR